MNLLHFDPSLGKSQLHNFTDHSPVALPRSNGLSFPAFDLRVFKGLSPSSISIFGSWPTWQHGNPRGESRLDMIYIYIHICICIYVYIYICRCIHIYIYNIYIYLYNICIWWTFQFSMLTQGYPSRHKWIRLWIPAYKISSLYIIIHHPSSTYSICIYICTHYVSICMYVCLSVCMYVCMDGWMYACMHAGMYNVYIYYKYNKYNINKYIYIYIHQFIKEPCEYIIHTYHSEARNVALRRLGNGTKPQRRTWHIHVCVYFFPYTHIYIYCIYIHVLQYLNV